MWKHKGRRSEIGDGAVPCANEEEYIIPKMIQDIVSGSYPACLSWTEPRVSTLDHSDIGPKDDSRY